MKTVLPTLLILFTLSCQSNRKEDLRQLVAEWNNREIVFPDSPQFTLYATDTIPYPASPRDSSYKVVIYTDSLGCMSCKLQLDKWLTFMDEINTISNQAIPFLFFMDTRNQKDMKHVLRRERFAHPVCIDTDSELNKLNNFPDNPSFHTFLLDHENRVVLIGNPVQNAAIKELYIGLLAD